MLVVFVGVLSAVVLIVWIIECLYRWYPAFVFGVQYRVVTALVKKKCIYNESPFEARISIYAEDGAIIRNPEFLLELINEIYDDFEDFVDYFELDELLSGKRAYNVTLVFYKENTYGILDRIYHMDTRGFYVPFMKVISVRTNARLSDLEGELGKTVRHEFFHYLVHALFIKNALTEQQEEGCARVFEEWRSVDE